MTSGKKALEPLPREKFPRFVSSLNRITEGKKVLRLDKGQVLFAQGDPADSVFFIKEGRVKLTVDSPAGRRATIGLLDAGDFLGEACLLGRPLRMATETALSHTIALRIDKQAMLRALNEQQLLSEGFMGHLLSRAIALEEDLCAQLVNHSEKRLGRVLLKLSRPGQSETEPAVIQPRLSHETLAGMVGTTRSRISYFMNRFKRLGLIEYKNGVVVHRKLLAEVVLHE